MSFGRTRSGAVPLMLNYPYITMASAGSIPAASTIEVLYYKGVSNGGFTRTRVVTTTIEMRIALILGNLTMTQLEKTSSRNMHNTKLN